MQGVGLQWHEIFKMQYPCQKTLQFYGILVYGDKDLILLAVTVILKGMKQKVFLDEQMLYYNYNLKLFF